MLILSQQAGNDFFVIRSRFVFQQSISVSRFPLSAIFLLADFYCQEFLVSSLFWQQNSLGSQYKGIIINGNQRYALLLTCHGHCCHLLLVLLSDICFRCFSIIRSFGFLTSMQIASEDFFVRRFCFHHKLFLVVSIFVFHQQRSSQM